MELQGLKSREKDLLPSKIPAELPRLLKAGAGFSGAELFPSLPPALVCWWEEVTVEKRLQWGELGVSGSQGNLRDPWEHFSRGNLGAWLVLGQG